MVIYQSVDCDLTYGSFIIDFNKQAYDPWAARQVN